MLLNCGVREDSRVPWTTRRSNQSTLKDINSEYSLQGLILRLKLQYSGHLMQRADSFEKTLMLGKIEGRRRRGRQRMRLLDDIINSMDMSFSKLRELVMDREACRAAVHETAMSWTWLNDWNEWLMSNLGFPDGSAVKILVWYGSGRYPGGGHGNPFQKYSCLENPMDRGTWQGTVHGVSVNQTRLKWLCTHAPMMSDLMISNLFSQAQITIAPHITIMVCLFSSVAQSCPTLCDPMNHSPPGLPIHHQLLEFTQTHVHWVGDAIQPSPPLSSPSPPALNLSQHQGLFQWVNSSHEVAKVLEFQLQHQSFQWTPRTDLL